MLMKRRPQKVIKRWKQMALTLILPLLVTHLFRDYRPFAPGHLHCPDSSHSCHNCLEGAGW
jgi:hypothetical protein